MATPADRYRRTARMIGLVASDLIEELPPTMLASPRESRRTRDGRAPLQLTAETVEATEALGHRSVVSRRRAT
jgi:hypothetical protein